MLYEMFIIIQGQNTIIGYCKNAIVTVIPFIFANNA